MKRLALLLALLVAPSVSSAGGPGRALVIYPGADYGISGSAAVEDDIQRQGVIKQLRQWKIRYTLASAASCNTWMVRRGVYQTGPADSVVHDVVIILGFQVGRMNTEVAGFCPESLTLSVCAPTKPVILVGALFNPFNQTAGCSTGVTACNLASNTLDSVDSAAPHGVTWATTLVGTIDNGEGAGSNIAYAWKARKMGNSTNATGLAAVPPGLWRAMVRVYRSNMTGAGTTCVNCDSINTSSGTTGKFQLWMRDQYSIGDRSQFKPIYFVQSYNNTQPWHGSNHNFAFALASADSFASGSIFGTSPVVRKVALVIVGLNSRRATSSSNAGGISGFPGLPSETVVSDSASFIAGMDSVAAYSVRDGIPVALGCEPDSLDEYPRDKTYVMDRLPNWMVFPSGLMGPSAGTIHGNASREHPIDWQGRYRARSAFGSLGVTQGPESCFVWRGDTQQTRDTSLACLTFFALNKLRAEFGNDRVLPVFNFSVQDYGSGTSIATIGEDSLFSAIATGGASVAITQYRDWGRGEGRYSDGMVRTPYGPDGVRKIKIASAGQARSTIGSSRSIDVTADYASKINDSFFAGIGTPEYQSTASTTGEQYAQALYAPGSILMLDISYFGTGHNGIRNFHGVRQLKYVANPIAYFNKLAGRKLIVWDWPQNVTTWH